MSPSLKSGAQQGSLLLPLFCISNRGSPCPVLFLLFTFTELNLHQHVKTFYDRSVTTTPIDLLLSTLIGPFKTSLLILKHFKTSLLTLIYSNLLSESLINSQMISQKKSEKVSGNISFDTTSSLQAAHKVPFWGGMQMHRQFLLRNGPVGQKTLITEIKASWEWEAGSLDGGNYLLLLETIKPKHQILNMIVKVFMLTKYLRCN